MGGDEWDGGEYQDDPCARCTCGSDGVVACTDISGNCEDEIPTCPAGKDFFVDEWAKSCCTQGSCRPVTCDAADACEEGYSCAEKDLSCAEGDYCPQFECAIDCDAFEPSCDEGYEWHDMVTPWSCGSCVALSCDVGPCGEG